MFELQWHTQSSKTIPDFKDLLEFLDMCGRTRENAAWEGERTRQVPPPEKKAVTRPSYTASVEEYCVVCRRKNTTIFRWWRIAVIAFETSGYFFGLVSVYFSQVSLLTWTLEVHLFPRTNTLCMGAKYSMVCPMLRKWPSSETVGSASIAWGQVTLLTSALLHRSARNPITPGYILGLKRISQLSGYSFVNWYPNIISCLRISRSGYSLLGFRSCCCELREVRPVMSTRKRTSPIWDYFDTLVEAKEKGKDVKKVWCSCAVCILPTEAVQLT